MFRWGWAHVIGAAVLLAAAAGSAWTYLGYSSLGALKQNLEALVAAHNAHDSERPVLRGDPLPGNAWEGYKEALAALQKNRTLSRMNFQSLESHRAQEEAVLTHESSLKALLRGSRLRKARLSINAQGMPAEASNQNLLAWTYQFNWLAYCQVERAWRCGDIDAALDSLFAWQTYRLDLPMGRGHYYPEDWTQASLMRFLSSGCLGTSRLRDLATALERWETALPSRTVRLRRLQLDLANALISDEAHKSTFFRINNHSNVGSCPGMLWNSPFGALSSLRLMQRMAHQSISWEDLPLEHQKLQSNLAKSALSGRSQDWIHDHRNPLEIMSRELRDLTQIRLLRAAACALAGDQLPRDPYGGTLLMSHEHGLLRIWSVGANGQDDDGRSGNGADDPCLELHFS